MLIWGISYIVRSQNQITRLSASTNNSTEPPTDAYADNSASLTAADTQSTSQFTSDPAHNQPTAIANIFSGPSTSSAQLSTSSDLNHNSPQQFPFADLILSGTICGSAEIARAIITDPAHNLTELFKLGDQIAGATLTQINRTSVTLTHLGKNFSLSLSHTSPASSTNNAGPDPKTPAGKPLISVSRPKTSSMQSRIIEDFLANTNIQPVIVNDSPQGLRISQLDKTTTGRLLGLKDNDIIQTINGQKMTSKQKAFQVFQKAKAHKILNIHLLRNNKPETLTFTLK
jgi:type II secretion system protein C